MVTSVEDVFTVGGIPTVTYYPRADLRLEDTVRNYLRAGNRILSVTGPTKCGKTVLLSSVLSREHTIWIDGGDIKTTNDFWSTLAEQLKLAASERVARGRHSSDITTTQLAGGFKPGGIGFSTHRDHQTGGTEDEVRTSDTNRYLPTATKQILETKKMTVVIDDFHFIAEDVQRAVLQSLKNSITRGLRLILASVKHHSWDAVRAESDLAGRVIRLVIPPWGFAELRAIARQGFRSLRVQDVSNAASRCAAESFGSPHLMQFFCLELCSVNGIQAPITSGSGVLNPPADWARFCRIVAQQIPDRQYQLLARGPKPRKERMARKTLSGRGLDMYEAVLSSIAHTGPPRELVVTLASIQAAMARILQPPIPRSAETARVLRHMSDIARKLPGEPILEFVVSDAVVHISDPFFAFHLRWTRGSSAPPDLGVTSDEDSDE